MNLMVERRTDITMDQSMAVKFADVDDFNQQMSFSSSDIPRQSASVIEPQTRSESQTKSKKKNRKQMIMTPFQINAVKFRRYIYGRSHAILSIKERGVVWEFLKSEKGQARMSKPHHHRYTWLKCSGAYNMMLTNPGYYAKLLKTQLHYPNQLSYQIEIDLKRTFPEESDPDRVE